MLLAWNAIPLAPATFIQTVSNYTSNTDNLTTFMCWLSWNLGAWNFWNPQGLSRLLMGLLYVYIWNWLDVWNAAYLDMGVLLQNHLHTLQILPSKDSLCTSSSVARDSLWPSSSCRLRFSASTLDYACRILSSLS